MVETRRPEPDSDSVPQAAETSDDSSDAYRVRAGRFEGPLDLLLHLVRINEIDITDIPIVDVTRQYNEYLDLMREFDLEVAGEYLVMAATLMHIKSRMLLPPDPDASGEQPEDDPRTELAQQLLEYQKYKQAAETLSALDSRRTLIWTRDGEVPEEFAGEELLTVDLVDLIGSFRKLLGRLDDEAKLRIKRDNVSVGEKISWLTDILSRRGTIALIPLMSELPTRQDRIAAFLAVLEMMRIRLIVAYQRKPLGEIRIAAREDTKEVELPAGGPEAPPESAETERTEPQEEPE